MNRIPFSLRLIRGAIGKRLVVKHYPGGRVVLTRYPDMSQVVPSEAQKRRRRIFKKANAYAKQVYASPTLKEGKRRLLRNPWHLYRALVKEGTRLAEEREALRAQRLHHWQRSYQQHKPTVAIIPPAPLMYSFTEEGGLALAKPLHPLRT